MANVFKRLTSRSIGTSAVAVGSYTVGAGVTATAIGLSLSNTTTAPITVTVQHYDGTNSTNMVTNASIPAGMSLVIIGGDQKLVLAAGDSVRVFSNTASAVDVILSVLEIS